MPLFRPETLVFCCVAVLTALFAGSVLAEDIYQCTDENGKIEYKNTGITKGCKKLNVEPVVVPKLTGPAANKAPSNFPRVDNDTQKSRDSDRRHILEDELKTQEAKLADLQKAYNNGEPERMGDERNYQRYLDRVQQMKDDIARTQSDIDSIRAELSKL
jgi:hypothetical protein